MAAANVVRLMERREALKARATQTERSAANAKDHSRHRLQRGTPVVMSDGWKGRVESDNGDTIVCIRNGEVPNDWLRGYRAFSRRELLTVKGGTAQYDWKPDRRAGAAELRPSAAELRRAKLEHEWNSAPY